MTASTQRILAAAEKVIGLTAEAMRPSIERTPEKVRHIRECLDGKHLDVMSHERIAEINTMLESHC